MDLRLRFASAVTQDGCESVQQFDPNSAEEENSYWDQRLPVWLGEARRHFEGVEQRLATFLWIFAADVEDGIRMWWAVMMVNRIKPPLKGARVVG